MFLCVKKHYFIRFSCLFLKLSKAFIVSLKEAIFNNVQGLYVFIVTVKQININNNNNNNNNL